MFHYGLIILVVVVIIFFQLKAFLENWKKMQEFKTIFKDKTGKNIISLSVNSNESGNITSIYSLVENSNQVWQNIKTSINEYLGNNFTGTIRFDILKNTIDRNCDAAEEDINTLNPLPLYLGLVGTMFGIIIGIGYLIFSGSLGTLMGAVNNDAPGDITEGVQSLLTGVAIAMIASVIGIILTTINSWKFNGIKTEVESNRNSVLVWLQANILPIVHSINNPSVEMANVVGQLESFNTRFVKNMEGLNDTLSNINRSYEIIRDLDVVNVTEGNVKVFSKLKKCTDNLDSFVNFFNSINTLHERWEQELRDSKSLEKIANFFEAEFSTIEQRKVMINSAVVKVDEALQDSFKKLNETYDRLINELNQRSIKMGEAFLIQLDNFPTLHKELELISQIPQKLIELKQEAEATNKNIIDLFVEDSNKLTSTNEKNIARLIEDNRKSVLKLEYIIAKNTEIINKITSNQENIIIKPNSGDRVLRIVTIICLVVVIALLFLNLSK